MGAKGSEPPANVTEFFLDRVAEHGEKSLFRYHRDGAWTDMSYVQAGRRTRAIAGGLAALGLAIGDRVAIMSNNRPEWALADLGSLCAGAVVVTVYPSLTGEDAAYIIAHSGAKVVFVENADLAGKLRTQVARLPDVIATVLFEGEPAGDREFGLEALEGGANPEVADARVREAAALPPDATFSILYTSGTTGVPKGVVLTHRNLVLTLEAVLQTTPDTTPYDLNLSFLPLAHALERFGGLLMPLYMGRTVAYARSLQTVPEDIQAVRPSFLIVVPRVLEKIVARFQAKIAEEPAWKQALVRWSLSVGAEASRRREAGQYFGPVLGLKRAIADRLVFSKIRARLGGNLKLIACGSAPLSIEIARFFHAAGISVCEGWGATETSAPVTINVPHDYRLGSVGKPLPGLELVLAPDQELLVRGPGVFQAYFKDEASSDAAFTPDGFYRTGDIGRVDADGYYYIVDRKKDLIITSGGKNVAPQKIENLLRERPAISNALVHGDKRPCLVALLTLDRDALQAHRPDLATRPEDDADLRMHIQQEVDAVNSKLPRFEQIKAFCILPGDFSHEGGELTLTLKLRRRFIEQRYQDSLESLYDAELLAGARP
ncbi:MAG: long-chain fatty acid--CoA ligase [Candidatus Sericytochromatia bacterium]|uniref:Acyl-CoA synthetase n=1 Tax=Candidatus Tanganyikabacteria bacterium TaxID=2961651 RepID=A0A937X422_9BACT|nr:long-chain fatty acid--CoA ligase [Candidatus Tanganyikabacteria bacterium]